MSDPTDAEIQAGADAIARSWRPLSPTSRRHLAKLVLVDVLPDHDARVRADERARVAGEILAAAAALAGTREETTMTEQTARSHPAGLDLDAIEARNAHRRCPNCGSETPDDIGTLLAELRRLRHQHGKVAGELADATMTMWHLEPGDRSDMQLAERITTLVAELTRQRDPHHPETGLGAT